MEQRVRTFLYLDKTELNSKGGVNLVNLVILQMAYEGAQLGHGNSCDLVAQRDGDAHRQHNGHLLRKRPLNLRRKRHHSNDTRVSIAVVIGHDDDGTVALLNMRAIVGRAAPPEHVTSRNFHDYTTFS
jgi:hypothetical protein